ncbi:MAG: group II intron reverse transcriptase/maturase [Methylococcaceae bacterium]|nr:group II intron reverse transcriptase/maturase [Methylococcaceae bacterium]
MARALMPAVLTDLNLQLAWSKVYENQGCAGTDGQTLEDFAEHLYARLDALRNEVRNQTYQPLPLLRVELDKPAGGVRLLSIPTVRDRILQTAVTRIIEPLFEAEFEDCSFAYRKGRSVDQAVARIQSLQRQGYHWVVDADIQGFFDNIDHTLLLTQIGQFIADPELLALLALWLQATVQDGKQLRQVRKGIAQGSPIAPLLSNLYLHHLDEALLDNNLRLIRFADDFLILCKSQDHAEQALELTDQVLGQLRLTLNTRKTQLIHFDQGFRFLGVQFIRSLAFKTDPDQPNLLAALPIQAVQETVPPLTPTTNAIQQAFADAGLKASQFPAVQTVTLAPHDEDDLPADHDPLLRTLYLLQHGQVLGKESERLVVRQEQKIVREIPAIKVDQIMVFGNAQISTQAMQFCLQQRIPIYLLSSLGRYYGVIDSFDTDPILLQREQFLHANNEVFCLKLATAMVHGKIANSRVLIQRHARRHNTEVLNLAVA